MKIVFLFPDGVGIKNYLYSNLTHYLIEEGSELILWHHLNAKLLNEVKRYHNFNLETRKPPGYRETVKEKFLRESASYARLLHNKKITRNETILDNWNPAKKSIKHKIFYGLVECYGKSLKKYDQILNTERRHRNAVRNSKYFSDFLKFLEREKPDILFNTHQRAVAAIPAMEAAKMLGITTVTAIYSWDNLPKARLATRADYYLLWSEYMRRELKTYYPEIPEDRMEVTGTPQFDFYHDRSLWMEREEFCELYGLDPEKKIICFSGDDKRTSPYDPDYLADLAEAVMQMDPAERPQILFRRCPADFSDRYDAVLRQYVELITVADPLWNHDDDDWSLYYPSFDDVRLLVNIARHCDLVYNVGSTMAHDFAVFDKPACYIRYDQPHTVGWSVETIYRFQHFRSMEGLDAVVWIDGKEEILPKIRQALENPSEVARDRRKWLEIITGGETNVARNIADFLTKKA